MTRSTKALSLAIALVLASGAVAGAAVTIRTAPFPGSLLNSGFVQCIGRNGGSTTAKVRMTLFSDDGDVLANDNVTLAPDDADTGGAVSLVSASPFFCECIVPTVTNFSCSLAYTNGPIHAVVPAQ
jgi:hypothetical protein